MLVGSEQGVALGAGWTIKFRDGLRPFDFLD
jgi:hypothetical protein